RMAGDNAMWMPGTDHAGIATQTVVEKRVLAEERKKRTDFAREDFVAKIQAWKDEYEATITNQLKRMGCSCDWDRQRFTMDRVCAAAVREAFFQLFKDGLIYRGKRLVNWDPATQTALADDEVEMQDIDGHFYYLKYPLEDGSGFVTVATTRPETMLGDTAVAINPRDPRAPGLRGKKVRLPIVNRLIPIVEDDYVVLPVSLGGDPNDAKAQFATGFLKVTPAHDDNDYLIGQRHGLPIINVLAPDATISKDHGWPPEEWSATSGGGNEAEFVLGMDRFEAREAVVEWFRKEKLLEEVKPYRHSVGHSYRSHVPIEPYLSDQWYVKVTDERLAGAALRAMDPAQRGDSKGCTWKSGDPFAPSPSEPGSMSPVRAPSARLGQTEWEGQLRFIPERYARNFQAWHENIRDWCISRQLWWGHRIPVWKRETFRRIRPSDQYPADSALGTEERLTHINNVEIGYQRQWESDGNEYEYICVPSGHVEIEQQLERLGYAQDPDVLDTWFSSALWPISTLGWPDPRKFSAEFPDGDAALQAWNPSTVLSTAREIITLWVSRMVMFNLYFRDCLPFKDVFIHAMIQDGQGRKMSKSLGNGVDPLDIIATHGADAMRFTLAQMTTQTQDVRMPVAHDEKSGKNTSPKFDNGRNFANKLWNAVRFALGNLTTGRPEGDVTPHLSLADRWILSRLARTIATVDAALADYNFNVYAQTLYDFAWRDLCDWYLEAIKPVVQTDTPPGGAARATLAACLDALLRLLHPVMPFLTEELWSHLNRAWPVRTLPGLDLPTSDLCITAAWPTAAPSLMSETAETDFELLRSVISAVREVRTTYKVPPRQKITASAKASAALSAKLLEHRGLLETLANIEPHEIGPHACKPDDAAATVVGHVEIYLHGLVDAGEERKRLTKRLEDVSKSIGTLQGRLSNESYISKAPPALVEQTRAQLAAAEREKQALEAQLAGLA
ncbi:MAG: valine--tRNA ligase, partial [Phycisphaeraceae bacterium]|nr:valine--tRNA ligase [Phycisphaeraceae bacterium]